MMMIVMSDDDNDDGNDYNDNDDDDDVDKVYALHCCTSFIHSGELIDSEWICSLIIP